MNRITLSTVVLGAILIPISPVDAQVTEEAILADFAAVEESIIRIKTIANLKYRDHDPRSGDESSFRPYSVDGTGVVVGQMWVEGRLEYLILTNHHVADASNYVLEEDGYLWVNPSNTLAVPRVPEESFLMQSADTVMESAIQLVELVRLVRGDMTLMRTVNANRELQVFRGAIGYSDGEVEAGAPIVTSGYPFGGDKVISTGSITAVGFPHDLGLAHDDFILSMPVQPGQSGGPVFLVERDEQEDALSFRLIGLVHAKDAERSFAVPYSLWGSALEEFPRELKERMVSLSR